MYVEGKYVEINVESIFKSFFSGGGEVLWGVFVKGMCRRCFFF